MTPPAGHGQGEGDLHLSVLCYDCQGSTSGRCAKHASVTLTVPAPTYPRPMPTLAEALAERGQARAEVERLRAAVQRVRALHTRGYAGHGPDTGQNTGAYCRHCSQIRAEYVNWPCETRRALDPEAPHG